MKVAEISFVIVELRTIPKRLVKGLKGLEIRGQVETMLTDYDIIRLEYWEEFWRIEETCCHSDSSEKASANANVKNCKSIITIILFSK